ncbi:MAG: alpha-N-arabinofuranosidase [Anaerolineae bacterium]|nr:alpha-N-arabinofuranosidase [Anaerolineae bacterium]
MNKLTVYADQPLSKINRHLYGHFAEHLGACIYDGIYVGEDSRIPNVRGMRSDIVEAMKQIRAPNLRWPGGCFADVYHWRDGIGPREQRPTRLNFWGNAPETNAFGTHEFMDLCEQIGCEPYIGGNVGSGTVQEMRDWIEYLTSNYDSTLSNERRANGRAQAWRIPFWGIGNENWGCGGLMRPEYMADLYCQYHNFMRNYGDTPMMRIASGLGGSDTNAEDAAIFMDRIMNRRHPVHTDGLSIHYYVYLPDQPRHSATEFGEAEWYEVLKLASDIDGVIAKNAAVLDTYDPGKRIWLIVDEWGAWYPVEPGTNPAFLYQQNSMRDAVVAALTLHIFQDHCDRVQMANLAQTVNVIQALFLTKGEALVYTPTFHVFDMLKGHQDATALRYDLIAPVIDVNSVPLAQISAGASRAENGEVLVTLANLHASESTALEIEFTDRAVTEITGVELSADHFTAHNTFDEPTRVTPKRFDGVVIQDGSHVRVQLPAASVVALTLV